MGVIQRAGTWNEWELASKILEGSYISLYAKKGDTFVFIPYKDLPTNTIKYMKFVFLNEQWLYADNSQHS